MTCFAVHESGVVVVLAVQDDSSGILEFPRHIFATKLAISDLLQEDFAHCDTCRIGHFEFPVLLAFLCRGDQNTCCGTNPKVAVCLC